jgi:hypothetical protein
MNQASLVRSSVPTIDGRVRVIDHSLPLSCTAGNNRKGRPGNALEEGPRSTWLWPRDLLITALSIYPIDNTIMTYITPFNANIATGAFCGCLRPGDLLAPFYGWFTEGFDMRADNNHPPARSGW